MKALFLFFMCALSLTLSATIGAAPVYRCGHTYTQTPCPGGKVVDATDPRTAAQRAEARRVAAREKRQAARMAKAASQPASSPAVTR